MITLDAAMERAGTTWDQVERDVQRFAVGSFGGYGGPTSMAFYMDEEGVPVFLVGAIVGESDEWPNFFTWDQGSVEWSGQHPMSLLEVDPLEGLFCRSGAVEYDGAAMISEEEAMEILREIYEVQEDLAQGMLLSPYGTTKYLDDAEHLCIAVGNDLGNRFETVWVYAVSYNSVYRLEDATGAWIPIGFG